MAASKLPGAATWMVRTAPTLSAVPAEWAALPLLPEAWEKKMLARRDAALNALAAATAGPGSDYPPEIERGTGARHASLLELEWLPHVEQRQIRNVEIPGIS